MAELTVDLVYGTALLEAARDTGTEKEILEDAASTRISTSWGKDDIFRE